VSEGDVLGDVMGMTGCMWLYVVYVDIYAIVCSLCVCICIYLFVL
jgi:hypothetical protein